MNETQEIRESLADSAREVLKLLGDVADLEKRSYVLKKRLEKIYEEIDKKLDTTY